MQNEIRSEFETQAQVIHRDVRTYARIILKYAPLIVIIGVVSTSLAFLYSWYTTPVYEAKTLIQIERENTRVFSPMESMFYGDNRDLDFYQTQYKLLKSRSLIKATLDRLAAMGMPFEPQGVNAPEQRISAFLRKIAVRPEPRSQLVQISVEDESPERAMNYANTLAEMYIKESINRRMTVAMGYLTWLKDQVLNQQKAVTNAETALQMFKRDRNVEEYQKEIAIKRDALIEMQRSLAGLKQTQLVSTNLSKVDAFKLEQQIGDIEEEINAAKTGINEMEKVGVQFRMLEQQLLTARTLYEDLLTKSSEYSLVKDFQPRNISVVDKAELPQVPTRPRTVLNLFFGLLFGLVFGVGLSFFMEYLDDTIKSPTDVEAFLRVPYLGLIPSAGRGDTAIEGIVESQPKGSIAESYRAIRTNILFSSDRAVKSLLFTSSGPGEGKTTTALNVSEVMARAGDRTVLIDADMRRPRLHKILSLDDQTKGLSNYLVGNAGLADIIQRTPIESLNVIAAGPIPPNPVELLNSQRLSELLNTLAQQYDRVIIDSPPIIAVTDAAILSRLVTGVVIAVHGGRAHRDIVKRGIETIKNVNGVVLGVILNNVNIYRASYYDYYYYSYYRYAYGYSYRKKDGTKRRGSDERRPKRSAEKKPAEL
ncbi:polysaccharide biosynthesis tyrosine autokinase [bacterium]|nr:polysaccharide biosynthesis tyrosine autokinase [bacterium]